MKIAILIYSLSGGGAERVVSYLLAYLKNKGIEVHLVLMNNTISYDIPKNIPIHYIETSEGGFENGFLKLIKLPLLAYKYAKLLNRLKITHSFALLTRPSYINILSRYFTTWKYKITISERSYPSMQHGYNNLQSKINNFLIKKIYPKADQIICNSQGNANDLINNYNIPASLIAVAHNPVAIEHINTIAKKEGFFSSDYLNIVTIGRLDTGKNHQLLIHAVAQFPKIRLYILGDGGLRKSLTQLITDLNLTERVFLLGFDNNPYKYLKAADLFLFGSNHEGFPNVLLEAMACGLPIVSTNCKSGPDEIMELIVPKTDDIMLTDYGILSPVGNVKLLQKALAYCLEHPEFLDVSRKNVKDRIQDFKREPILKAYTHHILS